MAILEMLDSLDRLGYYLVGQKKFPNKTHALLESKKSGLDISWIFNDSVYGNIDWSVPVNVPLMELYKARALQLRQQYDYLTLYYSGGADSTTVLHAFIDNNIFIDEILMWHAEPYEKQTNDKDYSNRNYNSEVKYAAMVHLDKVKNSLDPRTKITLKDFAKTGLETLSKQDNWYENVPLGLTLSISGILRQVSQQNDAHFLRQQDTGKSTCYIMGIDKPLVCKKGDDYYAYFQDNSAYHVMSPIDFASTNDQVTTEFFYWTPDFPEIVVKQSQLIKAHYKSNPAIIHMAEQSLTTHISEYRNIIHDAIYPREFCEPFQVEKPSTHIKRPMDDWFWRTADNRTRMNYIETIQYLGQNTDPKHMLKGSINWGMSAHLSKFYKL
jgi:hypothetical protein